jgi:hypothetical protein
VLDRFLRRRRPPEEAEPTPPPIHADPALDDLELGAARAKVATGDWTAARDVIAAAGLNWELRARRITLLSDFPAGEDGWLYAWLNAAPDDPTATMIYASMLSARATAARGSGTAAETTAEQHRAFAVLSQRAAETAARARDLADPRDPIPYVELLQTRFAGGDRARIAELYAAGASRDPFNVDLNIAYVSLLCEKWYGSHQEMFAVARSVAAAAPPGSGAAMMPYLAHFEYAMREFGWSERTVDTRRECYRYFEQPEIMRELDACAAKWRAAGPPALGRSLTLRHWQALGYVLSDRRAEAKAVFDEIGPYLRPAPAAWAMFWLRRDKGACNGWVWANS